MTPAETGYLNLLIDFALTEDLGDVGDVTTRATIPEDLRGRAAFVARSDGVLAGVEAAARVCARVDHQLQFAPIRSDGYRLRKGETFATVEGPMRSILTAERTALNFLQRLSGVATLTRQYVDAVAGLPVKILDTRKTTPGWRLLEKYAVRVGGGTNHRVGLYDMILIKDNHLAAMRHAEHGTRNVIQAAIDAARSQFPKLPIEIEVDALAQLDDALAAGPDIVLLDNMPVDQMRAAVTRRNAIAPRVQLESSGGVNLQTVRAIAETGVDRISVGALTHSAKALDIALDYVD
ncbi:MAG TPA: carboxylating nicotinate-nucleotide diphosphorylase [Gemmataceae bacterium]|nr:carboxylating nicotinate-nucleotide diphosphorylase [Gemmataceae bacterium]